jgi:hypothetical protein
VTTLIDIECVVRKELAQAGDTYVYGAETRLNDPDPERFDCSELQEWAFHQCGLYLPDGAMNQLAWLRRHGRIIPIGEAIRTVGALLFRGPRSPHVAMSLGNGSTIEARGRRYPVGIYSARGRTWTAAALHPAARYLGPGQTPPKPTQPSTNVYAELAKLVAESRKLVLRLGSTGPAVRLLQKKLQQFGQWVPETGVFDQATLKGVVNVQRWCHIEADGIVGPATWKVLFP